jgi:hypothetical protein
MKPQMVNLAVLNGNEILKFRMTENGEKYYELHNSKLAQNL